MLNNKTLVHSNSSTWKIDFQWKKEEAQAALRRCSCRKVFSKIYSKFTGEHPCRSVISINLLCKFIEITLQHGCSPVNLLYNFRTSFYKNTSRGLLEKKCITQKGLNFLQLHFLPTLAAERWADSGFFHSKNIDFKFSICLFKIPKSNNNYEFHNQKTFVFLVIPVILSRILPY